MRALKGYVSKFLVRKKETSLSKEDIHYIEKLRKVVGYQVRNPKLFREAFSLKFPTKQNPYSHLKENYERLEFLGDAILGSIISGYLFEHYPNANEGFMTQLKAKIISRKTLNKLGEEIGLYGFIPHRKNIVGENTIGNIFEALVGAVFLDTDYDFCQKIVLTHLLTPQKISELERKVGSYKSLLLEWSQREKRTLAYDTFEEKSLDGKALLFRSFVLVDDEKISEAKEASKKKAEEKAAKKAFHLLADY